MDGLASKSFYWDKIHPDSMTGLRAMGELAMHLVAAADTEMTYGVGKAEAADNAIGACGGAMAGAAVEWGRSGDRQCQMLKACLGGAPRR